MELSIKELRPGIIFSDKLKTDKGYVLMPARTFLTEDDINLLEIYNVKKVICDGKLLSKQEIEQLKELKKDFLKGAIIKQKKFYTPFKKQKVIDEYYKHHYKLVELTKNINSGVIKDVMPLYLLAGDMLDLLKIDYNLILTVGFGTTIKTEDPIYKFMHNLCLLCMATGIEEGLDDSEILDLGIGGLLSDIGMLKVPKYLREKDKRLDYDEFQKIKTHPLYSYKLITKLAGLSDTVLKIVLEHHENLDGTGYPRGLSGNQINEFSKIVNICNVILGMITYRPHRKPLSIYKALQILLTEKGDNLDKKALKAVISILGFYPIGTLLELSNKKIGLVIRQNPHTSLRPVVKILWDTNKVDIIEPYFIDLKIDRTILINKVVEDEDLQVEILDEV